MPFRQTYYTSCQQGLRGGKGFQINAASDGIDAPLLQQVERLGLYVPPVSAPSRPTSEEIEHFPVALLFQALGDGSAVIAQARYTGADYSGRFGNYFTHSLVSADPARDLGEEGLLPIELWGGPMWTTSESPTTTLPLLARPLTGGVVTPERVAQFLSEGGRAERLPAFLTAVHNALSTGRRIILVEESRAVALWIASASYALPRRLALRLTFSTYVKNPYQSDFLIVGTTADSDFNFAPHEIEHQFYVLDFEGGRFTRLAEVTPFARLAAAAYAEGHPHAVTEFGAFAERVAPDIGVDELDAAFACHARRQGFAVTTDDDLRVFGWCARRIGGFKAEELNALAASVTSRGLADGEILDAYTDLYLASLANPARPGMLRAVELPYLEWLIKAASKEAPLPNLERAAERLRTRSPVPAEVSALMMAWIKQVRQSADAKRLPALFQIADKLGFFDAGDESLGLVGEEVIGPALSAPQVVEVLERYAGRPGVSRIIAGAGGYLAAQVDSPAAFRPLSAALSRPEIYEVLVRYAFEQQALALYFRLVSARLPHVPAHPRQRLDAFIECVAGIRRVSPDVPGALAENAYDAVWQSALPTFEEAVDLLDLLVRLKVDGTNIPKRLVDLVEMCDLTALAGSQRELVGRLSAHGQFYKTLGEKRAIIDAYYIPAELESSGEELPQELQATLAFLEGHPELGADLSARAYSVVAVYLSTLKDQALHAKLLARGFKREGGQPFLHAYGGALVATLKKSSGTRPKVAARLVRIWTTAEQSGAKFVASTMFDEYLPKAIRGWRNGELEMVSGELKDDPPALRRWQIICEATKEQSTPSVKTLLGKLFGFNRGGNGKR